MAVEIKRKFGESVESLLWRFTQKVKRSGILRQARKSRFFKSAKSKKEKKLETLRRLEILKRREYLQKIGKLPSEEENKLKGRYSRDRRSTGRKK